MRVVPDIVGFPSWLETYDLRANDMLKLVTTDKHRHGPGLEWSVPFAAYVPFPLGSPFTAYEAFVMDMNGSRPLQTVFWKPFAKWIPIE